MGKYGDRDENVDCRLLPISIKRQIIVNKRKEVKEMERLSLDALPFFICAQLEHMNRALIAPHSHLSFISAKRHTPDLSLVRPSS